jgi:hypothetical protein
VFLGCLILCLWTLSVRGQKLPTAPVTQSDSLTYDMLVDDYLRVLEELKAVETEFRVERELRVIAEGRASRCEAGVKKVKKKLFWSGLWGDVKKNSLSFFSGWVVGKVF